MGAINADRLSFFRNRYENWDNPEIPKFMYGTHYSNVGSVLFFLIRMVRFLSSFFSFKKIFELIIASNFFFLQEPFTKHFLKLQSGRFDQPGRTFFSIPQAWENCLKSTSDLKVC